MSNVDEGQFESVRRKGEDRFCRGNLAFLDDGDPSRALALLEEAIEIFATDTECAEVMKKCIKDRDSIILVMNMAAADGATDGFKVKSRSLIDTRERHDSSCGNGASLVSVVGSNVQYVIATSRNGLDSSEVFRGKPAEFVEHSGADHSAELA